SKSCAAVDCLQQAITELVRIVFALAGKLHNPHRDDFAGRLVVVDPERFAYLVYGRRHGGNRLLIEGRSAWQRMDACHVRRSVWVPPCLRVIAASLGSPYPGTCPSGNSPSNAAPANTMSATAIFELRPARPPAGG